MNLLLYGCLMHSQMNGHRYQYRFRHLNTRNMCTYLFHVHWLLAECLLGMSHDWGRMRRPGLHLQSYGHLVDSYRLLVVW
jgi:hypothetical protein